MRILITLCLLFLVPLAQAKQTINCSAMRVIGTTVMELRKQGHNQDAVQQMLRDEMAKKPGLTAHVRNVAIKITAAAYYIDNLSSEAYGDFVFDQCFKNTYLQRSHYHPQL